MPGWRNKLKPRKRWDSLFYIWSLATSPQKIDAGQRIYEANCVPCHGTNGDGKGPRAKNLKTKPTNFTNRSDTVGNSSTGFYNTITNGEKPMPSFKDKLSADDRWNVIDYIWTFSYKRSP